MTSPVLLKMPDKRFWEMGIYKMSFLLPAEYQKSPPNPTNPEVCFSKSKANGWKTYGNL